MSENVALMFILAGISFGLISIGSKLGDIVTVLEVIAGYLNKAK